MINSLDHDEHDAYGTEPAAAWQLKMFSKSLKKQLKFNALLQMLGPVDHKKCLLISCGDNNGALNWHFRRFGGTWAWGDVEGDNIKEMAAFLGDPVHHTPEEAFPFEDDRFDRIVCIDVLEHLEDPDVFLGELRRVLNPTGFTVVTVPNGDTKLAANKIKNLVGMTPEKYGHIRAGYTVKELEQTLSQGGFKPFAQGGYSRFFTEMMELIINFAYVFVLAGKNKRNVEQDGKIAPTSSEEIKTHDKAFKAYSLIYPFMKVFSQLDRLQSSKSNNAVIVSARK